MFRNRRNEKMLVRAAAAEKLGVKEKATLAFVLFRNKEEYNS